MEKTSRSLKKLSTASAASRIRNCHVGVDRTVNRGLNAALGAS
jgi:hypothetical protein